MNQFKICEKREAILAETGHLLIEGGPGSGKTTIALLKAKKIIDDGLLGKNQKILFLSFARATVSRVEEQAKNLISKSDKGSIEINTYHGFAWSIIKSYAYLVSTHRRFTLITPPNLSAMLATVDADKRKEFKESLFKKEGIICFDLFSSTVSKILESGQRICSIISGAYPYIIVDEFQDTDAAEWKVIQLLGSKSKIIALADLDQRIYEFRGASITRIIEFQDCFKPVKVNLGKENNRSSSRDIVDFGNDILHGKNKGKLYNDVEIIRYPYYSNIKINLKYAILNSVKRLQKLYPNGKWSIAVLVKSKLDTLSVSSYLQAENISHEVLIDPSGPALSASIIARLLEPMKELDVVVDILILDIIHHIKGRKGDKLPQADRALCIALENYLKTRKIAGSSRVKIIDEIKLIVQKRGSIQFTGVPESDWLSIRKLFQNSTQSVLINVYEDARYLRLLNKGATLSEKLSGSWREFQSYQYAEKAIHDALTQEHFSMVHRSWHGIYVMNIHKSKGKEFDEVIIWEEPYKSIIYNGPNANLDQDKLVLRVAVTRAKMRTTFLTPQSSPCVLL